MERLEAGLTAADRTGLQTGQPKQRREVCKEEQYATSPRSSKGCVPLCPTFPHNMTLDLFCCATLPQNKLDIRPPVFH